MDYFLIFLGILLLITGLLGSILPIIPGPPISYAGMVVLHFTDRFSFSDTTLIVYGIFMVIITVLDYVVPAWGTKKMGGSKYGIWGSTIGLIVGLFFFPPLGLIIGPFAGAFIGEVIKGQTSQVALTSAIGSFLGFVFGTLLKLIYGILVIYHVVIQIF